MTLYLIDDGVPEITPRLLEAACISRAINFAPVPSRTFTYDRSIECVPGDLLYRPAVTMLSIRVEQFLYQTGVATFHRDEHGPFFPYTGNTTLYARAGLPTPRFTYICGSDEAVLRDQVDTMGGLPVVVKVIGYSGGTGVFRVDTWHQLRSTLEYLLATGVQPMMMSYVGGAVHWRVVVVGDAAAAAYRNVPDADGFKTWAPSDADDITEPPENVASLAEAAVRLCRLEFGGVDILQHPSGRVYLLEVNFPCYFAHAQEVAGIDVAGFMVDHLMEKSRRLLQS